MNKIIDFLKKAWDFIKKHKEAVIVSLVFLLLISYFKQCQTIKDLKQKNETQLQVNEQNMHALSDMTYQFKLTKEQLKMVDADLYAKTQLAELLLKENAKKPKIIEMYTTKIIYKDTTIVVDNTVAYNDSTNLYNISFGTKDLVRSFNVNNYVRLVKEGPNAPYILKDKSEVKDFKLLFDIAFAKYDDHGATRLRAFAVNSETNKEIPESVLGLKYRSVELLNESLTPIQPKPKAFAHGMGFSINPIGFTPTFVNGQIKMMYTPNISLGYYFGLNWNK